MFSILSGLLASGLAWQRVGYIVLFCIVGFSTVLKQGGDFIYLYGEKNVSYHAAVDKDKRCDAAKKSFADVVDMEECDQAKRTLQMWPITNAFVTLINTTWPHPWNLSNYVRNLWDSYSTYMLLVAFVLYNWSYILRAFFGCVDVKNRGLFNQREYLNELALQNLERELWTAQLAQQQRTTSTEKQKGT